MFNTKRTFAAIVVSSAMAGVPAMAQSTTDNTDANNPTVQKAQMQVSTKGMEPVERISALGNTWITLTGEVTAVDSHFFTLDYGDGEIFVELHDTDLDVEAYAELEDEEVMVTAKLDDGMFSEDRIIAQSVYVSDMDTIYLADEVDQASADLYLSVANAIDIDEEEMVLVGTVKSIGKQALQLEVGDATLTVELDDLDDGPIDEDGYLTLMKGERVRVTGELEEDFFNTFTVEAEGLTKMKS
tara:strand:+ start:350 stop:1075 length:726 start_codon:yes stop_codon:yes gene_type:complete